METETVVDQGAQINGQCPAYLDLAMSVHLEKYLDQILAQFLHIFQNIACILYETCDLLYCVFAGLEETAGPSQFMPINQV